MCSFPPEVLHICHNNIKFSEDIIMTRKVVGNWIAAVVVSQLYICEVHSVVCERN